MNDDLISVAQEVVDRLGYECLHVAIKGGKRKRVVVVIDTPGGVRVDDCVRVSQELSVVLDVMDPLPYPYDLEITSPGIERPIFKPEEYSRFLGKPIAIYLKEGVIKGYLVEYTGKSITLACKEKGEKTIPLSQIQRAHLLGPWEEV